MGQAGHPVGGPLEALPGPRAQCTRYQTPANGYGEVSVDSSIDLSVDELLTLTEAAHLLKVGPATCYRWAMSGRLRCWRRGGRLVTTKEACEALLEPVRPPPPAFGQAQRETAQQGRHSKRTEQVLREAGILP